MFRRILGCSGFRQIAWELGVSHSTIQRHVERLGRHCLLLHETLRPAASPRESLVLDGFRTFEFGQFWPFDIHLLIGASHFVYGFQDAELRRMGAMTRAQRVKRNRLERMHGRPDPAAVRKSVRGLIERLIPKRASVEIHSDLHRMYPTAFREIFDRTIHHRTISSKAPRTARNPLFPANLADLLIRHASANQKRETIAFSKRRQGALYRIAIWTVARNYVRSVSVRRGDPPPGKQIGSVTGAWSISDVLAIRMFPWRFDLVGWLGDCYFARIPTRRIPNPRKHTARYAV